MATENEKNVSVPVQDPDVGTMEDVQAMMEKYDRESNVRQFKGIPRKLVAVFFIFFSIYSVYLAFSIWEVRARLASFVGLLVMMAFILYPLKKQKPSTAKRTNYIAWYDGILGLLGGGCFFYFVVNASRIIAAARPSQLTIVDLLAGILGTLILLEACRRVTGFPIVIVASAFLLYAFVSGISIQKIVYQIFYTTEGILSTPISACATYIVLFIIFGAFLEKSGIADFFIQGANAAVGHFSGGPAKVAVIASAFEGMASGSSVANTVGSGSITIPLMKKIGYRGEFAAAVEATASTGGQIMPPIMGAAAFIMAEMTGIPYESVAVKAILPAALYFMGIFLMVHFEAKKLGLRGISRSELPKFGRLFLRKGYLLLPLVVLIGLISFQVFTIKLCCVYAIITTILISILDKILGIARKEIELPKNASVWTYLNTTIAPRSILQTLEAGARNAIGVGVACAVAGIIAGVITMTGLGQVLITGIVSLAGSYTIIALFLTMIACIILGMGVPTTANYIIMATTCAPILIKMGIPDIAAHMFVFYFGIVADITPPVALAAYAGAAIAKSNPMKTGFTATRLAIAAFIVPYAFALNPAMLFVDTTWYHVVLIIITSLLGMTGIAVGMEGYLKAPMKWPFRILSIAAGILLIDPNPVTDVIGIALLVLVIASQFFFKKKNPKKFAES